MKEQFGILHESYREGWILSICTKPQCRRHCNNPDGDRGGLSFSVSINQKFENGGIYYIQNPRFSDMDITQVNVLEFFDEENDDHDMPIKILPKIKIKKNNN